MAALALSSALRHVRRGPEAVSRCGHGCDRCNRCNRVQRVRTAHLTHPSHRSHPTHLLHPTHLSHPICPRAVSMAGRSRNLLWGSVACPIDWEAPIPAGSTAVVSSSTSLHSPASSVPRVVEQQYEVGDTIRPSEIKPGDLIFFNTNKRGDGAPCRHRHRPGQFRPRPELYRRGPNRNARIRLLGRAVYRRAADSPSSLTATR